MKCTSCEGIGEWVVFSALRGQVAKTCEQCNGTGEMIDCNALREEATRLLREGIEAKARRDWRAVSAAHDRFQAVKAQIEATGERVGYLHPFPPTGHILTFVKEG